MTPEEEADGEAVVRHFSGKGFVCPFARGAQKHAIAETDLGPESAAWAASAVTHGACVAIVASESREGFEEARAWVAGTMSRLRALLGCAEPWEYADGRMSPFLDAGGVVLYGIGMGPQYPAGHPRYAPRLCVALTDEAAIRAVPQEARAAVLRDIERRVGYVYDADDAWLPVTPRPRI